MKKIYQIPRGKNEGGDFPDKSPTLTSNSWQHNNVVVESACLTPKRTEYGKEIRKQYEAHEVTEKRANIQALEPRTDGKTNTLTTVQKDNLIREVSEKERIRRLTPTECARLQTIPTWYKWVVSETQQHKMLGNGWTVEVIKHIFSFLPRANKK